MKRAGVLIGSAAIAAGVTAAVLRRNGHMDLRGKVVLITGGSRGLGLAMARGFAERNAKLALCARSSEELDSAKKDLAHLTSDTLTMQCDVSDQAQVAKLIEAVIAKFGRIDVLVNNAGIIQVGPIDTMTIDDFEEAMDVIFWGTVHTTLAVLPHMRRHRSGRIVNITSIGAKVSVPHLVPYSCAKFAALAFSEGMRAELNGTGIKVVTIAPGLMRTGSHLNALFNGDKEAAWFSLGASLPPLSMNADRAASQIISAAETGRAERILTMPANFIARFHGLFPGLTTDLLGLVNRVLPRGNERARRGADTTVLQKPWLRTMTTLGRWAAQRYLQPGA